MKQIIVIQGNKNSGKDSTADYIQYILNSPRWLQSWSIAKFLKFKPIFKRSWFITRYAHKMKLMLADLMGISVNKFEDRDFKENYHFDFNTFKILYRPELHPDQLISDKDFNKEIKKGNPNLATEYILSIRQILQFFGTEVMRKYLGDTLWVLATLNDERENLIIADQRFIVENIIAKDHGAFIIHITRPNTEIGLHSSEKELDKLLKTKSYDVLLENNGTLKDLYNNIKNIIDERRSKILHRM